MSQIAKDFITEWVNANASSETVEIDEDETRAETLAAQCRDDAKADGINEKELQDAIDDLTGGSDLETYIKNALAVRLDEDDLPIEEKDD